MEMKKRTLEEIIKEERERRFEEGDFGMKACKESIRFSEGILHQSLFSQLEEYLKRANEDIFFNKRMVLACWELINGIE